MELMETSDRANYKGESMNLSIKEAVKKKIVLGNNELNGQYKYTHVGLAGTENYISHLGIVLMSLVHYNLSNHFMFHLFLSGVSALDVKRLEQFAIDTRSIVKVYVINDDFFSDVVNGMYTASFFYRFIMPDVIKNDADQLIYMDGDVMCCGDINELVRLNFVNQIAAVVSDRDEKKQINQLKVQRFFNSGMMVINVKQWIKENLLSKILAFSVDCMKQIDSAGRNKAWGNARYNDQNILNKMLDGRVLWLPKKYNYIYKLNRAAFFRKAEKNEDYKNQVILHFAGSVKPWHDWVKDWPVVKEYIDVWQHSPWKDVPMTKPVSRKDYHQAGREYRVTGQYGKALKCYWEYYKRKL